MESHQDNSASRDSKQGKIPDMQRHEDVLSPEMLQRYLKGLANCKKHRNRPCLSQELNKLLSS